MNPTFTKLAGVTQGDAQANIIRYGGPGLGGYDMIREPNNPHDPNAIRVAFLGDLYLGYLPAEVAQVIAPLMDQGRQFVAEFVKINRVPRKATVGMTVRIVEVHLQQAHQAG